jgi:hypothetical protein
VVEGGLRVAGGPGNAGDEGGLGAQLHLGGCVDNHAIDDGGALGVVEIGEEGGDALVVGLEGGEVQLAVASADVVFAALGAQVSDLEHGEDESAAIGGALGGGGVGQVGQEWINVV